MLSINYFHLSRQTEVKREKKGSSFVSESASENIAQIQTSIHL